jgi:PleD family two-component response regulator
MQAKLMKKGHYAIIAYKGNITDVSPGPLPEVTKIIRDGFRDIIINLSGVGYLNPSATRAIHDSLEYGKTHNVSISLAEPKPAVRRKLKLNSPNHEIRMYESEKEAMDGMDMTTCQGEMKKGNPEKILIWQKNMQIAASLRASLKEHPMHPVYHLLPVRELESALKILKEECVHCILIDAGFALSTVINFIEKLETDDSVEMTPIIIIANEDQFNAADVMVRNGADDILRYPLKSIETAIRIQTMISLYKYGLPFIDRQMSIQTCRNK